MEAAEQSWDEYVVQAHKDEAEAARADGNGVAASWVGNSEKMSEVVVKQLVDEGFKCPVVQRRRVTVTQWEYV